MLGRVPRQPGLFEAGNLYLDHVGAESIYAALAEMGQVYFKDDEFADLYRDWGRPSVPPSRLCLLLFLQHIHRVSDSEAVNRAAYDLRWKVALGLEAEETLCAKSTLQLFRGQLVLNERFGDLLTKSVQVCRDAGLLKRGKLEVAIDSTPILGRGAVKDTFNLISDQIRRVIKAVAEITGDEPGVLVAAHGLERHFAASFKGAVEIDWGDKEARRAVVGQLVADARIAIRLGEAALDAATGPAPRDLESACQLLRDLLLQDIEEVPKDGKGPRIRKGTAKDRVISTTDPEMRHGRKSESQTIEGYKGTVVADTGSGTILETLVAPANEHDGACAREAVEGAQKRAEGAIERVIGDTAYGTTTARADLESTGAEVVAKAPPAGRKTGCFSIDEFEIDPTGDIARCPAGKESAAGRSNVRDGMPGKRYEFSAADCAACPLRSQCTTAAKAGRTIVVTAVTTALRAHREHQKTDQFKSTYRRRVTIEHRIARLIQLGARQARYISKRKVAFQFAITAVVANLVAAISTISA